MSLPLTQSDLFLRKGFSRRQLGRIATLLTAGSALPFYNEAAMAQDAERRTAQRTRRPMDPDVVRINQNGIPWAPRRKAWKR
jgi:histidinol-phosphate aminotransferase